MTTRVFLSLSFTDVDFVRKVSRRLPRGVANFYERSFERGDDLIHAMEEMMDSSDIFVLFASQASLSSYAVQFEIEEARRRAVFGKLKRVIVFPIETGIGFSDLPSWLRNSWAPNIGESAADIARYITTLLLEPDRGLSTAAPKIVGRGATLDRAERITARNLQIRKESPNVYIFTGLTGIGRRTFASYYLRRALSAEANLPFGPTFTLSAQSELIDIYRALRTEIDTDIKPSDLAQEQALFIAKSQEDQITEILRVMRHFSNLGQAVTIVTAAGLFEDAGRPKEWVFDFVKAIPNEQVLVLVSNLQFWDEHLNLMPNAVQVRINELDDEDVKALMTFSAQSLRIENFNVSDALIKAIGGHPGVANAAVSLALQKGTHILDRDPRQLFNIQQTILGEAVRKGQLSPAEMAILDVLGWLPSLGGDLLESIVKDKLKVSSENFNSSVEKLILSCLITTSDYRFAISPSVRQLYRRFNSTPQATIEAMGQALTESWANADHQGFRDDLFSAFIFMQVLEGKSLPREFRNLLTPGNLHDTVREAYARGKETDDRSAIKQAIAWGLVAVDMTMSEGVREEILSIVARAQIRIRLFNEAEQTLDIMRKKGYRSVTFLEGHLLRKKRDFKNAIPKLRFVVDNHRHNKAAVHELALCYRRLHKVKELEELLKEHGEAIGESAVLLDFSIALDIARGNLAGVPEAIRRLRSISDQPYSADLRQAQLLMKQTSFKAAVDLLSQVIENGGTGTNRLRALRAYAAARDGNFKTARGDLRYFKSIPDEEGKYVNLETEILLAEGKPRDALEAHLKVTPQEPGDWLVRASVYEALSTSSDVGLVESQDFAKQAIALRQKYPGTAFDLGD